MKYKNIIDVKVGLEKKELDYADFWFFVYINDDLKKRFDALVNELEAEKVEEKKIEIENNLRNDTTFLSSDEWWYQIDESLKINGMDSPLKYLIFEVEKLGKGEYCLNGYENDFDEENLEEQVENELKTIDFEISQEKEEKLKTKVLIDFFDNLDKDWKLNNDDFDEKFQEILKVANKSYNQKNNQNQNKER